MINDVITVTQSFEHSDGRAVEGQETSQIAAQQPFVGQPTYQMWSSVLNTPLTQISGSGTKMKTKIFAGGAMIAEQNAVLARMEWISADPVTGSSAKILRSGLFVDEERKELEPLGQEILPVEPPNEQPAPSPENVRFSAQESEWQCKASEARFGREDFFSKPIHCQKAALAANDVGLYSLHPYKEEKDISTASDITRSYSFRSMMPDRMMTYSLRSSAKKTDGDHDDDDDDGGSGTLPAEYVEVNDELFPGFEGANVGGIKDFFDVIVQGRTNYVNIKGNEGARDLLKNVLSDKCKDAIANLIGALEEISGVQAITYDLLALFDDIANNQKQGGFNFSAKTSDELNQSASKAYKSVYGSEPKLASSAYGYAFRAPVGWRTKGKLDGDFESFIFVKGSTFQSDIPGGLRSAGNSIVGVFIHELIHVSASLSKDPEKFTMTYKDDIYDAAAKKVGVQSFDVYIGKNCVIK